MANKIKVLVPVLTELEFEFTDYAIGPYSVNRMRCDGCAHDMGPDNPKGVFKVGDNWYKLCNRCLQKQVLWSHKEGESNG